MRSEQEMLALILETAREDERIRAVILNGSRADPAASCDCFQDFDILYLVTDVASFVRDPRWIDRFGERTIMQTPDAMASDSPHAGGAFAYLMQFADGNRIDLRLFPVAELAALERDSLSVLLLDKDGLVGPLPPPDDRDYLPIPPTDRQFADCCNEFLWVCPYAAKGLWRKQITYAKAMQEMVLRPQLMKILEWYVGAATGFRCGTGYHGKHLQRYLEPELWDLLTRTYSDAGIENTWDALEAMGELFRLAALRVATHFQFDYPEGDDARVTEHLARVRSLPDTATEMFWGAEDHHEAF
jgi:aminoglycoside 6-adenylyltransferase